MHLLSFNSFFPILINLPKGPFNIHDILLKRIFFLFALFTNTTLPITADCQENPAIVAGKDVVVVSINHRLNTLGFLDLSAYGEKYRHSVNH
jgi:hypothetical protein